MNKKGFLLIIPILLIISIQLYSQEFISHKILIKSSFLDKEIIIDFPESVNLQEYKIINIVGETIFKKNIEQTTTKKLTVDVSFLKPGIYFIIITTNKSIYTTKFIKK